MSAVGSGQRGAERAPPTPGGSLEGPRRPAADGATDAGDEALLGRPSLSIRTRMTVAFALIFSLCVAITVGSMYALSDIEARIHFLEVADSYLSEVQEARRYEKNFLLYGTDLDDAIRHLEVAVALLDEDEKRVREVVGAANLAAMRRLAGEYRSELAQLGSVRDEAVRGGVEAELRRSGAQMVSMALQFRAKEREAIHRIVRLARWVPIAFLAAVLAVMVFVGVFFARQLYGVLRRFTEYTARIGAGDFTPIPPARRYRDEFSELAIALNRMVRELDHHQRILVESHKLRAIGTLVAGVAHELNNPLNNIMLTAAVLEEDEERLADGERLEMVRDILSETERSKRIVGSLLDFARESETRIEPLAIAEIVGEAVQLVANQVRMAGAQLAVDRPPDLPPVHGDRQMLCQVFVNLILNATDAVAGGGRIEVTFDGWDDDGYLAVAVRDDGPGVPEHVLPQLFDPFFTTKPRGKGTGLGLSVSQGIVRKLGGDIVVATAPGRGTTFTVLLPVTRVPSLVSSHHG